MSATEAPSVTVDDVVEALDRDGYCIVRDVLSPDDVAAARSSMRALLTNNPSGRNDFEGFRTQRVYALFAKTRAFDGPATDPLLLGVLDRVLGHYQLSAPTGIQIGPGEKAQILHRDDQIYPLPPAYPDVVVNTMWALDDFTEANGATRLVPGSHRWTDRQPGPEDEVVRAVMPAGTVLFYVGKIWHGGGANTTDRPRLGVILEYAAAWLRAQENHILAPPRPPRGPPPNPPAGGGRPRETPPPPPPRHGPAGLRDRPQGLLGKNISPPFVGYVDGRHPRRYITEGVRG